MKIEKINENQIRCTLTSQDLASRHLKVSELAYGTEKAKMLFHDMMQQANYEFGFEAEDMPLMIEAIPVSAETIILLITKVEYPEELDTRFSKFSEAPADYNTLDDDVNELIAERADDIIGLFKKLAQDVQSENEADTETIPSKDFVPLKDTAKETSSMASAIKDEITVPVDLTKIFLFRDLSKISRLAKILEGFYDGENSLYKEPQTNKYHLVLHKNNLSPEVFNKVCNILSEYANQEPVTAATEAYFIEHYTLLCKDSALQTFAQL